MGSNLGMSTIREPRTRSLRRAAARLSAYLGVALMAACGGSENAESAAEAPVEPVRHLGLFVAGDYVEFEACSGLDYAIDGPVLADLVAMRDQLVPGLEPLEAVFVDLLGTINETNTGAALDAIEMRRVAYEGGGCSRDDSGIFFRGLGNEPFWSVAIAEDGLSWTTPEGTTRYAHSGLRDGPRGEWIFDALDAEDRTVLTATITPEPCVDQMSGSWYHLTMRVDRGADAFRGCAYLGPEMEGN